MTAWMLAGAVLVASLAPSGIACFRGRPLDRLAALEMSGVVLALAVVVLSRALHRGAFTDLAIALAVLGLGGALVFVRAFERWL